MDRDTLIDLREALSERARIPEEEHREHHDWVRGQIERQQARTRRSIW